MRAAVISDVHANLHALDAVLAAVRSEGADEIWCLGDIVGLGPHPDECASAAREFCQLSLAGNHDLALSGRIPPQGDMYALDLHYALLGDENLAWLRSLAPAGARHGVAAVHAAPWEPVVTFVSSVQDAARALRGPGPFITLFGHTHQAAAWRRDGRPVTRQRIVRGQPMSLQGAGRWLLNPGAVGRPQGGRDARASWMLLDLERNEATWHSAGYDISSVQAHIHALRMPAWCADSLPGR